MALDGRATREQINLIISVAEPAEVLYDPHGCLAIRHGGVHVVLPAPFADAEALEGEVTAGAEVRFDWPLLEDGGFMPSSAMPFFMTLDLSVILPAISTAPEKDISPSPLREMEVANTELGALDMNR